MTKAAIVNQHTGATEVVTPTFKLDFLSADITSADAADHPITLGSGATKAYSYEQWLQIVVLDLGNVATMSGFKVWALSPGPQGSDVIKTNARESGYVAATYATPVNTASTVATQDLPTSEPNGANIGIGGSLAGTITDLDVQDRTDLFVLQLEVDPSTRTGVVSSIRFQWDETV